MKVNMISDGIATFVPTIHRRIYALISQPDTYVVGTQNNHLNEMALLSTQNKCLFVWFDSLHPR